MREDNSELKHSPKADIYSYMKTIWMILLNRDRSFVGPYGCHIEKYLKTNLEEFENENINTFSRLNKLIERGTKYTPINRPSIDEVICELEGVIRDNNLNELEVRKINE